MNNVIVNPVYRLVALGLKNIKNKSALIVVLLTTITSFSAQAFEAPESFNQCVVCHGDQAQGNSELKAPVLAGLSSDYLKRQLMSFRAGHRGAHEKDTLGAQMTAISQQLDLEKDIPDLVKFIAALPSPSSKGKMRDAPGDLKNGSRYYQAKCGACHSGKAEGNPSFKSPQLAGQDTEYLKRQIVNFQTGIRGSHPDDKLGRQMAMMSKMVKGKELDDILYYISQQTTEQE